MTSFTSFALACLLFTASACTTESAPEVEGPQDSGAEIDATRHDAVADAPRPDHTGDDLPVPDGEAGADSGEEDASDASDASTDVGMPDSDAASTFTPAPHPPFPLVSYHGGPTLGKVELVPVYFEGDPLRSDLDRFNAWIVQSTYWDAIGKDYGVGSGSTSTSVVLPAPSSTQWDETTLTTLVQQKIADSTLPPPTNNTLYAVFLPPGNSMNYRGAQSCQSFAGFHNVMKVGDAGSETGAAYALIPRCSFEPGDELLLATNAASHEYIEAATNPLGVSNPAWLLDGQDGTPLEAWQMLNGLEVSDLCENQSFHVVDGFTVQDSWSNGRAQAGENPRQPSDTGHPFFMVSAGQTIYHASPSSTLQVKAVSWSNRPAADWSLGINWGWTPRSDFNGNATLSRQTVNNGDEVTINVTIPALVPPSGQRLVYRFTIDSIDPINPNFYHPWPVMVVVP